MIAADPKPIIGFSDVTALLYAAWRRIGLVTVHGPFVGQLARMDERPGDHLRRLLCDPELIGTLPGARTDGPRRGGVLDGAVGIVVGALRGCQPPDDRPSATAEEVIEERLGPLGLPVMHGFDIGHTRPPFAVPVGARARIDADAGTFEVLEPAVQSAGGAS